MITWAGAGTPEESIEQGAPEVATGYALSPRRFVLLRRQAGDLKTVDIAGHIVDADLTDVYQLVLFDATGVFRWAWDQRARQGRWSWLDDEVAKRNGWAGMGCSPRLVIGSVKQTIDGWALTAQTGEEASSPIWVPFGAAKEGQRLMLDMVEYVSTDEHGNKAVVAERPCDWRIL